VIFVKLTGQNVNEVRGNVETTRAFAQPPPTITRPRAAGGRGMYPTCFRKQKKTGCNFSVEFDLFNLFLCGWKGPALIPQY
jgi:hypothetical protein